MPRKAPKHTPNKKRAKVYRTPEERKQTADRQKRRALHTGSKTWRQMRAAVLMDEPLCRYCKQRKPPKLTPATEVDHADGDTWNNDLDNLVPACKPCHARKTAREDGGFGNRGMGYAKV